MPVVSPNRSQSWPAVPAQASRLAASAHQAAEAPAAVPAALGGRRASLAVLLTGHILQDGELVLLILKPSFWFIPLASLRFIAATLIVLIAGIIFANPTPARSFAYVEAAMLVIGARLAWASLQWMGRFYVLTDLRILRLSGVLTIELFDCPLRKISRTRLVFTTRERLLGLGSVEIVPQDEAAKVGTWQTISDPHAVHDRIVNAIDRAKHAAP